LTNKLAGYKLNNKTNINLHEITKAILMSMSKRVLNVRELAKYLGVHPITIYNYLKRNEIPAFRMGKVWRFNRESIDKWRLDKENESKQQSKKKKRIK